MELFQNLTDDQTAILGCLVLFVGSGIMLTVSYYVGQMTRSSGRSHIDVLPTHSQKGSGPQTGQSHKAA